MTEFLSLAPGYTGANHVKVSLGRSRAILKHGADPVEVNLTPYYRALVEANPALVLTRPTAAAKQPTPTEAAEAAPSRRRRATTTQPEDGE